MTAEEPSQTEVMTYAQRKERQKMVSRIQKKINETEKRIETLETRLGELDTMLCDPKNAADMALVNEYTDIQQRLDKEMADWEKLSEQLETV